MASEKPSKVEVGQRWRYGTSIYTVAKQDGDGWLTDWPEDDGGPDIPFGSESIMEDEFVGYATPAPVSSGSKAADWLRRVALVLEKKSRSYGDSVGKPMRVFSKAGVTEGIKVRIDDKLSRVARGKEWPGDDVIVDLVGYLALLAVVDDKDK